MTAIHQDLQISWEAYYKTGEQLVSKIKESGVEFDQIVCIARGGMFVGDLLSRVFKKKLAVIAASSYRGEDGKQKKQLIISKEIAMTTDTLAKRILLVDDLVDSGDSLIEVKKHLRERYEVSEVYTAVLWYKPCSKITPDFFADTVDSDTWIHQPFECYDNYVA